MSTWWLRSLWVLAAAVLAAGCGGPGCPTNTTQSCACIGGVSGVQTCEPDGTWGVCECPRTTDTCGDGLCSSTESCSTCATDCGQCPVPTGSCQVSLPVTPTPQYCSEWCWTAALTMIDNYFGATYNGQPPVECEFESSLTGQPCCNYAACSYAACNQGAGSGQTIDYYLQLFGVHGNDVMAPLTEAQMQNELTNGRPFIVGFMGPTISHVVVVSGFDACNGVAIYHLIDPYFGPQDISYQQFAYYGPNRDGTWFETWYGLATR